MPVMKDYTLLMKMPENLAKLRNDRAFCDVILRSGLREVYAHRIILAALSDYFSVLFKYEGGFEKPAIDFDEDMISGECLENIVTYAYTGDINICEENVCDLLLASDYFDIPFIRRECEKCLNELQTEIINFENLPNLIWVVCHFNLKAFLGPICMFVSEHFAEISESNILLHLSSHSLLTMLHRKDFTVLYNGVPAADVEFEFFKLVVCFINGKDLTDNITIKLLQMIHLSEITHEQFVSVLESSRYIQKKEIITRVFNFRALPLFIDEEDVVSESSVERKYSRQWKYVEMFEESTIALHDRARKIRIYTVTGISSVQKSPASKWYPNRQNDNEYPTSVKRLSLTYQSGITVTVGDTSEEPVLPFDNVCSQKFILADNEVIEKLYKTPGILNTIKFVTNFGNRIGPIGREVNSYSDLQMFSSKSYCGYFHSFGQNSTIDNLKLLWVEYSDPVNYDDSDDYSVFYDDSSDDY